MPGPSRRCLPASLSPLLPSPFVFLLLVLGTPACSSSFARLFLRRQPSTPRLRGSDNGELALSSWFIASFDCQVHAAESVHPPSFPRPPRFSSSSLSCRSSYRCRPPLFPLFTALSCLSTGETGSPWIPLLVEVEATVVLARDRSTSLDGSHTLFPTFL